MSGEGVIGGWLSVWGAIAIEPDLGRHDADGIGQALRADHRNTSKAKSMKTLGG